MDLRVRTTSGPRDASRLAAEAVAEGVCDVIVAGGDGTINEAVQGLVGTTARLAIWPRGTANVLGNELKLPRRLHQLADIIAAGRTQRVHVGCAILERTGERRYFLLMAGIGLDAAIAARVRPALKKHLGQAAFWYSGLEELITWKPRRFQVEVHGKLYPATFAAFGKSPHYGGSLSITPRARLDAPQFEICLIDSLSRMRYLQLLPMAMLGRMRQGQTGVTYLQATQARAASDDEGAIVQVDGEILGPLPASFEITPYVMEIVV